jgi:hypothetical protein
MGLSFSLYLGFRGLDDLMAAHADGFETGAINRPNEAMPENATKQAAHD